MYENYWHLQKKPFENCADPEFYYPGESPQSALLKLRYAVENRRGGALLSGASGTGKTLIVAMLRNLLGENYSPFVHLVFPQMNAEELLAYVADKLTDSFSDRENFSISRNIQRIEQFLTENSRAGRHPVIVIDEAHLLESRKSWEALRLLLNFECDGHFPLTLLVVGQTAILPMLERMPQLDERLGVKCLLRPFNEQETAAYAAHRMKIAGAAHTVISTDAFSTLHQLSGGIPRQINRLCDLALLIGFAEEHKKLRAADFQAVCQELVSIAPE
ncbi:MAG: ExeA family protein [Thermoguttaceae bacterium]